VDEVLRDGQEVKLGDAALVAHRTPGHTKGCTTWTLRASEGGKLHQVVIIGSPNVNPGYKLVGNSKYPTISDDFASTFQILKSLPCDVFLGAHGDYYGLQEKYARLQKGIARLRHVATVNRVLTWAHWLWFFEPYLVLTWILLRPSSWDSTALSRYQALGDPKRSAVSSGLA
jgi:glyoxylase-like metal-dependent hydrolase (beta-lactamase superfamily II)